MAASPDSEPRAVVDSGGGVDCGRRELAESSPAVRFSCGRGSLVVARHGAILPQAPRAVHRTTVRGVEGDTGDRLRPLTVGQLMET